MTELLSVTAEDVEAFCVYDTESEIFVKAFRSSADVYEDDIEGNKDQDPDNYYCWDYETFALENINSTYEDGADVTIGESGLKIAHVDDALDEMLNDILSLALDELNVVATDPRFVLIKWYPTSECVYKVLKELNND